MTVIGLLVLGLLTGVASGVFGIGGGVILTPALAYFFHMKQQTAVATSLMVLMIPVGSLGVYNYYKNGFVGTSEIKIAVNIAVGIIIGALVGSMIGSQMSSKNLTKLFAVFLFILSIRIWMSAK